MVKERGDTKIMELNNTNYHIFLLYFDMCVCGDPEVPIRKKESFIYKNVGKKSVGRLKYFLSGSFLEVFVAVILMSYIVNLGCVSPAAAVGFDSRLWPLVTFHLEENRK